MPNNAEAEKALLGSVILDPGALDIALELGVAPEDFYLQRHRLLFQRMIDLGELRQAIDFVTLGEELSRDGMIEVAGGAGYIASLTDGVPVGTTAAVGEYCRIVKEKATIRKVINASKHLIARSLEGADDAAALVELAQSQFFELADQRISAGFVLVREIVRRSFGTIDALFERRGAADGVETGFVDLDGLIGCLGNDQFIVIAARPSQGKTALALNIAAHVALQQKKGVGFFSLEMSESQLILRLLCAEARVDTHKLRTGFASREDWGRMTAALGRLAEAPLYIDDSSALGLGEMRAKARRLVAEKKVCLIIVDFLQLVKGEGENRTQEVSSVSRALLAMAKELHVPVIGLSQMSRLIEQRSSGKPQLSDLRESGSIEQDAHVVIFIFRLPRRATEDEGEGLGQVGTVTGLDVAKQRNGPTGELSLVFLKPYVKFENVAPESMFDGKAAAAGQDR
jgi:replicative DNA helicase